MRYRARTGIVVDIENLGKNNKCIAVPQNNSLEEIRSGVWLKKTSCTFSKNNFTNIYDLFWDQNQIDIVPWIHSSHTPYSLADQMEKDSNMIAVIDGAFFFLTDVADWEPLDLPYNLCIRNKKILGLPSWDHPIAYIESSKLKAQNTHATGEMIIGNKQLKWVGAHSKFKKKKGYNAVLYNSKCSDVVKVRDPKTNIQIGILDNKHITTPKNKDCIDIVVGRDKHENLAITHLNKGGRTHFFDGLFILQMKRSKNTFHVGDHVVLLTLDGLNLQSISSAITVGRSVHDPFFIRDERVDRHDARSILAQDSNGFIHFMVFDGSKYVPGFRGVSAKEISPFFSHEKFNWAYFLDGGGSARIVFRQKGKLKFLANEFAFIKLKNGEILWDWQKARKHASSISIRLKAQ